MDTDDNNSTVDAPDDKGNIADGEADDKHDARAESEEPTAADTFLSHVRRSFWDDIR